MRISICENYCEMSKEAAKLIASQINLKPDCVLGFATGSTPIGMYHELCEMYKKGEIDFSSVTSFNLDEYYPIKKSNPESYNYYMWDNLFSHVNINPQKIHIPDGETLDPDKECEDYENAIAHCGGIDLQILGIGRNGHIGFNEPNDSLDTKTHVTYLTESTLSANSRFFASIDEVPKKAITMGVSTILKSKKIVMLVSGSSKHHVIKELLSEKVNTAVPATLLNIHRDVVVICDKEAYYGNDTEKC